MSLVVDEMLRKIPIGVWTIWTAASLNIDPVSFNDFAERLLLLEINGVVRMDRVECKKENQSGKRLWAVMKFIKLKEPPSL